MPTDGTPHMVGVAEWGGTSRVLISLSKAILQVCCKASELLGHQRAHWGLVGQYVQELQPSRNGDGECPAKQPGEGALHPRGKAPSRRWAQGRKHGEGRAPNGGPEEQVTGAQGAH